MIWDAHEQFNVYIRRPYKKPSQKRQTIMTETVNELSRRCKTAFSYAKKNDDGKSTGSDERPKRIESSDPYVIQDRITFTMNEMARAADVDVHRSLTARIPSGLVQI